jgi:hypothetical protein
MFSYIKGYSPVHNVKAEFNIQQQWSQRAITMIE